MLGFLGELTLRLEFLLKEDFFQIIIFKNKSTLKAIHLGIHSLKRAFLRLHISHWKRRKDTPLSPSTTVLTKSLSTKNQRQGARKEKSKTE